MEKADRCTARALNISAILIKNVVNYQSSRCLLPSDATFLLIVSDYLDLTRMDQHEIAEALCLMKASGTKPQKARKTWLRGNKWLQLYTAQSFRRCSLEARKRN